MSPFRPTSESRFRSAPAPAPALPAEVGLFSPDEVQTLMRVEFERAQRYHYALSCLLVAVDRLERLQDLHGLDTKREILDAVTRLVRSEVRESDLLTCHVEDRLLVIIPHTPPEGAEVLAKRLLTGARRLEFWSDGRRVPVSLSIGGAFNKPEAKLYYDALLRVAEGSLDVARQGGGDRYVHSELYDHFQKKLERDEAAGGPRATLDLDAEDLKRILSLGLERSSGDREALERARAEAEARADRESEERQRIEGRLADIERERDGLLAARSAPRPADLEAQREIENLQRRIAKLTGLLSRTEDELKRIASLKDVEAGVASVYTDVQGLDPTDQAAELKRDLMKKIFDANLELKQAMARNRS